MGNKQLEQLKNKFNEDNNILVTGQAGVGKTFLLNEFVEYLEEEQINYELAASTGIAAINIEGTTIHRLFGLGIASNKKQYEDGLDRKTIFYGMIKKAHRRINEAEVIIIDEVSMIGAGLLELIHYICSEATGSHEPFGGKQIILFGDFLQLPPINEKFAFESDL